MAASDAYEIKIHDLVENDGSSCVLGVNRAGSRLKIVCYSPANVVLHSQLAAGSVYRLDPAPSKKGSSAIFSYSTSSPVVTLIDGAGFPEYPAPIGVAQIDGKMNETYQDIRVTVSHDFGSKEYSTKRGKVLGRQLLCEAPGDMKFDLVLWGDKIGAAGLKKGVTAIFFDVWIRKNTNTDKPPDRLELSGSLSSFGYSRVDTLLDDVVRAFDQANSPLRKRKLSVLAGLVSSPGAAETPLRAQLLQLSVPGSVEETEPVSCERAEDESADHEEEEEDPEQLPPTVD